MGKPWSLFFGMNLGLDVDKVGGRNNLINVEHAWLRRPWWHKYDFCSWTNYKVQHWKWWTNVINQQFTMSTAAGCRSTLWTLWRGSNAKLFLRFFQKSLKSPLTKRRFLIKIWQQKSVKIPTNQIFQKGMFTAMFMEFVLKKTSSSAIPVANTLANVNLYAEYLKKKQGEAPYKMKWTNHSWVKVSIASVIKL